MFGHARLLILSTPVLLALLLTGCVTDYPPRDPVGQALPAVRGENLLGERVALPGDLRGRPALLLVIYHRDAQDDVNYWAAVATANMPGATILEVAAFTELKHRLMRRRLTRQGRERIPDILQGRFVSVWDDGHALARFTGSADDRHARVLLLDERGRVMHFCDDGFSHTTMRALLDAYQARWGHIHLR